MSFLLTHSLLSSWLYYMTENKYADATQEDKSEEEFMRRLRREHTPPNDAMQNGIDFENLVTSLLENPKDTASTKHKWHDPAQKIADVLFSGQLQLVASKAVTIHDMEVLLYGRLDALKAGTIYDIKFTKKYERGKYLKSTQHPMYFELVPEAERFTYMPSNGTDTWTETYLRDETPSIIPVASDFFDWLKNVGLMEVYKEYWGARG